MEQSKSTGPADAAAGIGIFVGGAALLGIAAWLLDAAATYEFAGPPVCDGETMQPGDQCLAYGSGDSYDYEEGMRESQSTGETFRAVGGIVAGGVGAALLWIGTTRAAAGEAADRLSRKLLVVAAALLAGVAAFLLTVGTFAAGLGALGAGLAAAWMLHSVGWMPLSRAASYAAGLAMFAGAAYLVAAAASYQVPDPPPTLDWKDPIDLFFKNLVAAYGDWVRLLAGALLATAGVCLVYMSADAAWDPDYRTQRPDRDRLITLVQYLLAALAVAGCAAYLATIGAASSWVGVAVASLLVLGFVWRGVRPAGPGHG